MLALRTEAEIVALLRRGTAQRVIAGMLGVSRDIVRRIARGERPATERARRIRDSQLPRFATESKPRRCPTCGAKVFMPCVACGLRRMEVLDEWLAESADADERDRDAGPQRRAAGRPDDARGADAAMPPQRDVCAAPHAAGDPRV